MIYEKKFCLQLSGPVILDTYNHQDTVTQLSNNQAWLQHYTSNIFTLKFKLKLKIEKSIR